LKQAPRAWNKRIHSIPAHQDFSRCVVEFGVYVRWKKASDVILICLYVDDLLVTGSNKKEIDDFKKKLMSKFKMADLRVLRYFLYFRWKTAMLQKPR